MWRALYVGMSLSDGGKLGIRGELSSHQACTASSFTCWAIAPALLLQCFWAVAPEASLPMCERSQEIMELGR